MGVTIQLKIMRQLLLLLLLKDLKRLLKYSELKERHIFLAQLKVLFLLVYVLFDQIEEQCGKSLF